MTSFRGPEQFIEFCKNEITDSGQSWTNQVLPSLARHKNGAALQGQLAQLKSGKVKLGKVEYGQVKAGNILGDDFFPDSKYFLTKNF